MLWRVTAAASAALTLGLALYLDPCFAEDVLGK